MAVAFDGGINDYDGSNRKSRRVHAQSIDDRTAATGRDVNKLEVLYTASAGDCR